METVSERFLRYVSMDTMSDENSTAQPSTPGQSQLGQALVQEMQDMSGSKWTGSSAIWSLTV